jgi:hypothetical protein
MYPGTSVLTQRTRTFLVGRDEKDGEEDVTEERRAEGYALYSVAVGREVSCSLHANHTGLKLTRSNIGEAL